MGTGNRGCWLRPTTPSSEAGRQKSRWDRVRGRGGRIISDLGNGLTDQPESLMKSFPTPNSKITVTPK